MEKDWRTIYTVRFTYSLVKEKKPTDILDEIIRSEDQLLLESFAQALVELSHSEPAVIKLEWIQILSNSSDTGIIADVSSSMEGLLSYNPKTFSFEKVKEFIDRFDNFSVFSSSLSFINS